MMKKKLPNFLQPYLASYNLEELSVEKDKKLIITSILNNGDQKAVDWLVKTYSQRDIINTISQPTAGFWYRDVLEYWLKIFDVKVSRSTFQKSLIQL